MDTASDEEKEIRSHVTEIVGSVIGVVRALGELAQRPKDRANLQQVLGKVRRHLHGAQVTVERLINSLRSRD